MTECSENPIALGTYSHYEVNCNSEVEWEGNWEEGDGKGGAEVETSLYLSESESKQGTCQTKAVLLCLPPATEPSQHMHLTREHALLSLPWKPRAPLSADSTSFPSKQELTEEGGNTPEIFSNLVHPCWSFSKSTWGSLPIPQCPGRSCWDGRNTTLCKNGRCNSIPFLFHSHRCHFISFVLRVGRSEKMKNTWSA